MNLNSKHLPTGLVILGAFVLAFSFSKTKQSELHNNTAKELIRTVQNPQNTRAQKDTVTSLREAFTGKWFKNNPVAPEAGTFDFNSPENTRNTVDAKKKDDTKKKLADKKKKEARKKKLQAYKLAKRKAANKKGPSLFDYELDDEGIPSFIYYPYNQNPQNPQVNPAEEAKQWTLQELIANIQSTQSVAQLVQLYKNGDINAQLFYGAVDSLFRSSEAANHTLGFSALSQTPSIASFSRHITYLEAETNEEVRTAATAQLEIYKQIGNLPVLNTGLNNSERDIQSTSALFLQQVADFLIQSASINPGSGDDRNPSSLNPQVLERYRIILRQSVNIMTAKINSGSLDAELVAQYTQSRARIEQFLSTSQEVNSLTASFQY